MVKKWSEDDEIYLEYLAYDEELKNYDDAAEFLGRSNKSIRQKLYEMRRELPNIGYIEKPWTDREIEFLRKNYLVIPADKLAERLRRTEGAVFQKAYKSGIRKRTRISDYDLEIREMASKGMYRYEIARELGLNANSVLYYINRNKIPCKHAPKEANQKHFRDEENLRRMEVAKRYKGNK